MTVVGVMPEGFDFPGQTSIWMPRELSPQNPARTSHNSLVVARLAVGATLAQANSEISALSRALKAQHGDQTWMEDAEVVPMLEVVLTRELRAGETDSQTDAWQNAQGFLGRSCRS